MPRRTHRRRHTRRHARHADPAAALTPAAAPNAAGAPAPPSPHPRCPGRRWSRAKFEIATGEEFNPIKQDTKNGKLREYKYGDMLFNYGAFPQTWEDPAHISPDTGCAGDNDPIDACEIGTKMFRTGAVHAPAAAAHPPPARPLHTCQPPTCTLPISARLPPCTLPCLRSDTHGLVRMSCGCTHHARSLARSHAKT